VFRSPRDIVHRLLADGELVERTSPLGPRAHASMGPSAVADGEPVVEMEVSPTKQTLQWGRRR